jgi:hypothetical protein
MMTGASPKGRRSALPKLAWAPLLTLFEKGNDDERDDRAIELICGPLGDAITIALDRVGKSFPNTPVTTTAGSCMNRRPFAQHGQTKTIRPTVDARMPRHARRRPRPCEIGARGYPRAAGAPTNVVNDEYGAVDAAAGSRNRDASAIATPFIPLISEARRGRRPRGSDAASQ